jgi:hypothetical protein
MAHNIQTRSAVIAIKLTPAQYKLIDQRAKRRGVRMSTWVRLIVLQAANAASERVGRGEDYLRIREPDGVTT